MTPFSFVYWIVCPSLYVLWWLLSLLSIGLSILLFMTFDDPFLFFPLGCLPFFSLWPLMTPFSFVHWVVCPSLYGLWWSLSLLSIGLSVLLLFMNSDDPFLFYPLGCLSFFSLWPLMTPFSFVRWVFCPSSLYDLWWPLSLWSIGLSVLLFMTSDDPGGCWNWPDSVVFCCFFIGFWNCPDCGILLFFMDVGTALTVWYFVIFLLELSWQCGIMLFFYWNWPDSVVLCYFSIGTVLTVWYFVVFHRCWNWPDSVVFCCFSIGTVLTVWYCVVFLLDFGTVLTVVFCCFSWMLELFWQCGILLFFY